MFSPFYAWSRRRGGGDPLHHCALNVVLYGPRKRWALTERGRTALDRGPAHLRIGPSALRWDGDALTVRIDEVTAPVPSRIRGVVRVHPAALTGRRFTLDEAGRHRWSPVAPISRVEVELARPALRWSGPGYLDTNDGSAPLEEDFTHWDWCRAPVREGAAILYNTSRRVGGDQSLALRVGANGGVEPFPPPPRAALPRTLWRVGRETRADGGQASVRRTLEDTPFYARSVLNTRLQGWDATAVHESLQLRRFSNPVVQAMLAFRVPRAFR